MGNPTVLVCVAGSISLRIRRPPDAVARLKSARLAQVTLIADGCWIVGQTDGYSLLWVTVRHHDWCFLDRL
ncbi:MAG: hypothetical protein QM784_23375 [Polyangiaceae bacterium]